MYVYCKNSRTLYYSYITYIKSSEKQQQLPVQNQIKTHSHLNSYKYAFLFRHIVVCFSMKLMRISKQ